MWSKQSVIHFSKYSFKRRRWLKNNLGKKFPSSYTLKFPFSSFKTYMRGVNSRHLRWRIRQLKKSPVSSLTKLRAINYLASLYPGISVEKKRRHRHRKRKRRRKRKRKEEVTPVHFVKMHFMAQRTRLHLKKGSAFFSQRAMIPLFFRLLVQNSIKEGFKTRQFWVCLSFLLVLKFTRCRPLNLSITRYFSKLFRCITPLVFFIPRTFGRSTYKVPTQAYLPRSWALALRKLLFYSHKRPEESFILRVVGECTDSLDLKSATTKWKHSLHLEAFENKSNLSYLFSRWI